MEQRTKVHTQDKKQELFITREFNLPVKPLFKAFEDKDLFDYQNF